MKRLLTLALLLLGAALGLRLEAQQVQQFSQYRYTGFGFNPAFAGSTPFFQAFAAHRSQWAGIVDAPRTFMMGLHAPSKSLKMGYGGSIYTDVTGPTRRFGFSGSYAYHVQLNQQQKVSFGLSFGLTQFTIDGSQITLREEGDQALMPGIQSELKPDASFGILWYTEDYHLGISAMQLLQNKLELISASGSSRMETHYFLTGAYRFRLDDKWSLEPSALVKLVQPLPAQYELSLRTIYQDAIWLGGSYRSTDAAVLMAGYRIKNYLTIGYAYDISTSAIRNYSDGTHEVLLEFRFSKRQLLAAEK